MRKLLQLPLSSFRRFAPPAALWYPFGEKVLILTAWPETMENAEIMPLTIEIEQEDDGRWLAEVPELPGVMTYGRTRQEAIEHVQALSLRILAERLEHGEAVPEMKNVFTVSS